uniref:Uncharacterized protein n=1 Tax=Arundo donax TaxID=35708 RepID=A0A0A9D4S1_ARUDO
MPRCLHQRGSSCTCLTLHTCLCNLMWQNLSKVRLGSSGIRTVMRSHSEGSFFPAISVPPSLQRCTHLSSTHVYVELFLDLVDVMSLLLIAIWNNSPSSHFCKACNAILH